MTHDNGLKTTIVTPVLLNKHILVWKDKNNFNETMKDIAENPGLKIEEYVWAETSVDTFHNNFILMQDGRFLIQLDTYAMKYDTIWVDTMDVYAGPEWLQNIGEKLWRYIKTVNVGRYKIRTMMNKAITREEILKGIKQEQSVFRQGGQ